MGEQALSGDEPDQGEAVAQPAASTGGGRPLRFRDDAPVETPPAALSAFLAGQSNATAVRLEGADDARALLPHLGRLALVEVAFPSFRDGRGYSAARILREGGYRGELRAEGDVLVDQIAFMRRCGFDSFAPAAEIDAAALERALGRYAYRYQAAADAAVPVWKLRHGYRGIFLALSCQRTLASPGRCKLPIRPMTHGGWTYIMTNRPGGVLYVGVSSNLAARIHQHRIDQGSSFCRRYRLKRLVHAEPHGTIEDAIMREKQLKAWRRAWKAN